MSAKTLKHTILFLLLIAFGILYSCDFDQVENQYSDYESANKDEFFEKGWIPKQIVYESMTGIYLKDNLDLNTFAFSYSASKKDLDSIKNQLTSKQIGFKNPARLSLPNWWTDKAKNMKFDLLKQTVRTDSIFIAIDFQENKIYGFSN